MHFKRNQTNQGNNTKFPTLFLVLLISRQTKGQPENFFYTKYDENVPQMSKEKS